MAFFDKIGETISSKSKGVAQKAKDMAEVSDLNKQINQCNQKINDSYMEIGYYYYQAHKEDGDDPFAAQCANIRQAMEQADALRMQIQAIKGVKVCPNCHAEVPRDSQFCGYCGCRITPQGQAVPQNAPYGQPGMASPYSQPQVFEGNQAAPVSEPVEPQVIPASVPAEPSSESIEPQVIPASVPAEPSNESIEPQVIPAGEPVEPQTTSTIGAGIVFDEPMESKADPSVCPGCGSPVDESDIFCGECGRKLK
ncbi:zinc-ribbon domain-containing protein [Hominifimenecus sp. rT4P-3]|uniref:zinc-ribbon domain-containing protein n=1 Tax=Hominifimenecus sp. rT4P-3 TaxID=3242979 RepID=UPI003DA468A9